MSERWREVLRSVPDTTASAVCYIGWHYPVVGASLSCRSWQLIQALCPLWRPRCCVTHRPTDLPLPQGSRGSQSSGRSCRFVSTKEAARRRAGYSLLCPSDFPDAGDFLFCCFIDGRLAPPTSPRHRSCTFGGHIENETFIWPPPTSVPSDPFLLFLFFVHFTVKQRFWLRIWPSDKKTHRYLTIFKPDKVKKKKKEKVYFYLEISNETFQRRHGLRIEKKEKRNSFVSSCIVNVDNFICIILKKLPYQF